MVETSLRPREYCELAKLASRGKRRVSHKAHGSIEWLQHQLWDAVIEANPEPEQFESTLWDLALQMDSASGPARALANEIVTDWRWARESPRYTAWLRGLRAGGGQRRATVTPRPFIDTSAEQESGSWPARNGAGD